MSATARGSLRRSGPPPPCVIKAPRSTYEVDAGRPAPVASASACSKEAGALQDWYLAGALGAREVVADGAPPAAGAAAAAAAPPPAAAGAAPATAAGAGAAAAGAAAAGAAAAGAGAAAAATAGVGAAAAESERPGRPPARMLCMAGSPSRLC